MAAVHDPTAWQERLLHELADGIPDSGLEPVATSLGATGAEAAAFLRGIRRALCLDAESASGPLELRVTAEIPEVLVDAVSAALTASGFEPAVAYEDPRVPARAVKTVVIAQHLVEPHRSAALMASDVPHLPVVFTGTGAQIGPFVQPGRTACLACVAADRRDADPTWPMIAAQLIGRPLPAVDPVIAIEAGIVAARLFGDAQRFSDATSFSDARGPATRSMTLRAGSLHRTSRRHRPHADCRCRSLEGSATADDPARPAPTRATATAQRA